MPVSETSPAAKGRGSQNRDLRYDLRFVHREGVREQETEPGTLVTGQIPVTTMVP